MHTSHITHTHTTGRRQAQAFRDIKMRPGDGNDPGKPLRGDENDGNDTSTTGARDDGDDDGPSPERKNDKNNNNGLPSYRRPTFRERIAMLRRQESGVGGGGESSGDDTDSGESGSDDDDDDEGEEDVSDTETEDSFPMHGSPFGKR